MRQGKGTRRGHGRGGLKSCHHRGRTTLSLGCSTKKKRGALSKELYGHGESSKLGKEKNRETLSLPGKTGTSHPILPGGRIRHLVDGCSRKAASRGRSGRCPKKITERKDGGGD